jgi:DNA-binding NarL/FixJ family response regulator
MIRILIVDDHPEARIAIEQLLALEPEFQVVGIARDGIEAIEQARALLPDAVVMDYNMPDMDGFTAAEHILDEQPNIAVIILSLHDELEQSDAALDTGVWDLLTKPVTAEVLNDAIWAAFE